MRPVERRRSLAALGLAAAMAAGCAGAPNQGTAPIATLPDAVAPPVPTLDPPLSEGATDAAAAASDPVPAPETDTPPPPPAPATPAGSLPTEEDPADVGSRLGVAGLAQLLDQDPDLAGPRGPDLQEGLATLAERPGGSARRLLEQLQDRIPRWVDDDDLDPGVGAAALAALEAHATQLPPARDDDGERGRGDDDRDDDDDDDD